MAGTAGFTIVDEDVADGHVGRGSYGKVFLAIHESTGERAAVKKIAAVLPSADTARELRIFSELKVSGLKVLVPSHLSPSIPRTHNRDRDHDDDHVDDRDDGGDDEQDYDRGTYDDILREMQAEATTVAKATDVAAMAVDMDPRRVG